jgi:predicted metalloprotease with PDZ domain
MVSRSASLTMLLLALGAPLAGQGGALPGSTASLRSAPIYNVQYTLAFTQATAQNRSLHVSMGFRVETPAPVLLSLPIWTPGAYEVTYFARFVSAFTATQGGSELDWDKADFDTWRLTPKGPGTVTVEFDFRADQFDNAKAWAVSDFAFVNGTNVFLYPEGRTLSFPATVTVETTQGWKIATGMKPGTSPLTYTALKYDDLVDMPFFIGNFDLDSAEVSGRWTRLATYPAGALSGQSRATYWDQIKKMIPVESATFGETPWDSYTIEVVFDSTFGGGSALEHQNSHLSLYHPGLLATPVIPSITAHEIIHAWNVKRLRPADMVPYRYDEEQPTTWLWVSEGITDYYADLTMVRGGIAADSDFYSTTTGKIAHVDNVPPVALEDASLQIWIHPVDNTDAIYYDKGSLAGLLLDIIIRDGSNNQRSLDHVMRDLYRSTYKQRFRGFTAADWWGSVSRAAGGRSFTDFNRRYVDGRDPFPWDSLLPLAGMRIQSDTQRVARMGVSANQDSAGVLVTSVVPGGAMQAAGVQVGDILVSVAGGALPAGEDFGAIFRARMADKPEGTTYPVVVKRGGQELTLTATLRYMEMVNREVVEMENAPEKARRIREGILRGQTSSR